MGLEAAPQEMEGQKPPVPPRRDPALSGVKPSPPRGDPDFPGVGPVPLVVAEDVNVAPLAANGQPPPPPPHPWRRFVAVGDSFTEGLDDPEPRSPGGYRGWADRVAEELSNGVPDFAYANLAVRGQLLQEVVGTQISPALALNPDLVSIQAGGNNLLHPGADPDKLAALLEDAVIRLRSQGVTVVIFAGPDAGRSTVMGQFRTKIAIFNENMRSIAKHHDALIADLWAMTQLHDSRMWSVDRLHPSAMGHHEVAAMVLNTLNVAHSLMPLTPKPLPAQSWREARVGEILWARDYLVPFVLRGIRHEPPNGGFGPKRPVPAPLGVVPLTAPARIFGNPVPPLVAAEVATEVATEVETEVETENDTEANAG